MNNNENAQRSLNSFENSIHSRSKNKNITHDDYTENLATKSVGNLVDGSFYDEETLNNSNSNRNPSYNNRRQSRNEDNYRSPYDTGEYDFNLKSDEFHTDALDSLNGLSDDDYSTRKRKPYAHEIPYKRPNTESYDELGDYDIPERETTRQSYNDTSRYNSFEDTSSYFANNRNNQTDDFYEDKEDYIKRSFENKHFNHDTSNLAEIEDVKNFYTDTNSDLRSRREHNRRMAQVEQENFDETLSTLASLNAIRETPQSRRRTQKGRVRYKVDDTLKNKIDFNENDPYIERQAPRRNERPVERPRQRRNVDERRRREQVEQKQFEERKKRLSKKRMQDTSMQPVIKGYTGTIPTINNQRFTENKNTKSYPEDHYDDNREYTQRQPASETRRPTKQKPSSSKRSSDKRGSDEIYRRRFERQVSRTIVTGVIGAITTILALIAFFIVTYNYNKLKDDHATVNNEYQELKMNQPDVNELQFRIDELEELNQALLNQNSNGNNDNTTIVDDNNNDNTNTTDNNNNNNDNTNPITENRVHVVKSGDYLSNISIKYYGNANHIQEIKDANGLTDDNILVGQELIIP